MRLQTDPEWRNIAPELAGLFDRWACEEFSLMRIQEIASSKNLQDEQVPAIHIQAIMTDSWNPPKKILEGNCFLNDPQGLLQLTCEALGSSHRLYQIGFKNLITGEESFWGLREKDDGTPDKTIDFMTIEGETPYGTPTEPGLHVRAADENGIEIYNPDPSVKFLPGREVTRQVYYQLRIE